MQWLFAQPHTWRAGMPVPHHTVTRQSVRTLPCRHFGTSTLSTSRRPWRAVMYTGAHGSPPPRLCRAPGRAFSSRPCWQQRAAPSPDRPRWPPAPARPRTSRRPGLRRGQRAQGQGKGPPRRRARRPARPSPHPGAPRPWTGARARARAARCRRRRGRRRAPPRRMSGRRRTGRAHGAACARACASRRGAGSAAGREQARVQANLHRGGCARQHARSSAAVAVCWASALVIPGRGAIKAPSAMVVAVTHVT